MMATKLPLTIGLLPACSLLASPINKKDLLYGSAGKLFKFDGRQQAVQVVCNRMGAVKSLLIFLFVTLCGCQNRQSGQSSASTQTKLNNSITEKEIYEFMQVAIADQKLQKKNSITLEPQSRCDLSLDNKDFLKTLLTDTTIQKKSQIV